MEDRVSVTTVGSLVIIHRDNPPAGIVRDRVRALVASSACLPERGIIEVWPGAAPDEFMWRTILGVFHGDRGSPVDNAA